MSRLIKLQYGDRTILVEAEPQKDEIEEIGAEEQVQKVHDTLGAISDIVIAYATEISKALEGLQIDANRLESAKLELGVKFTGSGNAFVVKAAADASLRITLTWECSEKSA